MNNSSSGISIWKKKYNNTNYSQDNNVIDNRDLDQIQWRDEINSSEIDNKSFRALIKKALAHNAKINQKRIGELLGYKETYIRNTIGECGRTTNRDLIISICICAGLTAESTNFGLRLYGLPLLDSEYNDRDCLIQTEISRKSDIDVINKVLTKAGHKCLDVNRFKSQEKIPHLSTDMCEVLLEDINCSEFPEASDISMKYNPLSLLASAVTIVKKKNDNSIFRIRANGKSFSFKKFDNTSVMSEISYDIFDDMNFKNADECPDPALESICYKLQQDLTRKINETKSVMDDTKNYKIRYDCRVENGVMKAYAETFDYDEPEYGEYFQMIKYGNSYTMTVTHKSQFLNYHVDDDIYKMFYKSNKSPILLSFQNIEDIHKQKELQNSFNGPAYFFSENRMIRMYKHLQSKLICLLKDIKEGKIDVIDPKWYDDLKDRAEILDIDSFVDWKLSEDGFHYEPTSYEFELKLKNNTTRTVSFDEVDRAIRVGVLSYDDFQLILSKYKEIEDFIC